MEREALRCKVERSETWPSEQVHMALEAIVDGRQAMIKKLCYALKEKG